MGKEKQWYEMAAPRTVKERIAYLSSCEKSFEYSPMEHTEGQFNTVDTPSTASDVRRTEKFHTLVVGASESMRCMCGRVVRASTMHMIEVLPCCFKKNLLLCDNCIRTKS